MQRPAFGDTVDLPVDGALDFEPVEKVHIVAVDLEQDTWTAVRHSDGSLVLLTFDENGNWSYLAPQVDWHDA